MSGIDVFIPCYNYGRYLPECVASVMDQPGCEVRVLLIDDASTDDSLAVARAIAAADRRVEVRAHSANRGHIATYNEGIDWVRADTMLLLSADDLVAPGALTRAVALLNRHPAVGFVFGQAIQFGDATEIAAHREAAVGRRELPTRIRRGADFIRSVCAAPRNPIETATVVVRTSLQKRLGGYAPELPHSGDLEMWLRLAAHGDVGSVEGVQAFTRIHRANMRHGYKADRMLADYQQRHLAFAMFFAAQGPFLADVVELRALALRSLAEEILWAAAHAFEEFAAGDVARLAALARTVWPPVVRTPLWWKLAVKQRLGPRLWRMAAPVVSGARRLVGRPIALGGAQRAAGRDGPPPTIGMQAPPGRPEP